jgi:hypothetical protein
LDRADDVLVLDAILLQFLCICGNSSTWQWTKVYIMGFLFRQLKGFELCKLNRPLVIHKTGLAFGCCVGQQWNSFIIIA